MCIVAGRMQHLFGVVVINISARKCSTCSGVALINIFAPKRSAYLGGGLLKGGTLSSKYGMVYHHRTICSKLPGY